MHLLLFSIQSIVFDCYAIQIRMLSLSLPELKKNFLLHRRWTMAAPGIVFSMDVAYWFPSYPETPFLLKKWVIMCSACSTTAHTPARSQPPCKWAHSSCPLPATAPPSSFRNPFPATPLFPDTVEPLYSGHSRGTTFWPLYRGGLEVLFCTQTVNSFGTWVPGHYQRWPLFRGGR